MAKERVITKDVLKRLEDALLRDEKADETVAKYMREAGRFADYMDGKPLTETKLISYKRSLLEGGRAPAGINAALVALRALFKVMSRTDLHIKNIRTQRNTFAGSRRMMTKNDYMRLLNETGKSGDVQTKLIMETIAGTGIRVSELKFFTLEAVEEGEVVIRLKGKVRKIIVSDKLRKKIKRYCRTQNITEGVIFRNKKGNPIHRSQVWQNMKKLSEAAKVSKTGVFPHNLRKLFAKTWYKNTGDIAGLADMLGHTSINTTRIYIRAGIEEHRRKIENLGLVL